MIAAPPYKCVVEQWHSENVSELIGEVVVPRGATRTGLVYDALAAAIVAMAPVWPARQHEIVERFSAFELVSLNASPAAHRWHNAPSIE